MRVAIVTESFFPQCNGVSNTVHHVATELHRTGHRALVIAPGRGPLWHDDIPVVRTRSVSLPQYRSFALGVPDRAVLHALDGFSPDLVHLASPVALGAVGLSAAQRLGLPTVSVYQTDLAGFARHYGLPVRGAVDRWVGRLHRRTGRTLAPSTASLRQLEELGVPNLHLWRRGVDVGRFHPGRRDAGLRATWQGGDQDAVVVGYVGRLAAEKQVRRLTELADVPGVRLVVIGEGPERAWLERRLPDAVFTGQLGGDDLAAAFASLDVFVHTGEAETFCQTVQEAQASGVPVVAPAAGGPLDLVEHRRTGLLHEPGDPASFRRAVARLVWDRSLRLSLSGNARAAVEGRSWSTVVQDLVDVHYASVLAPRVHRPAA